MRLPYPSRFEWRYVALFASCLFVGQLACGTDFTFALLVALYVGLTAGAFNQAGGLAYPSGAFIFFNSLLVVVLGVMYKVLLFEPGQTHLLQPTTTMLIYCGSMAAMWGAAWGSRQLRPKRGLLSGVGTSDATMMQAAAGSLVLGLVFQFLFNSGGTEGGTIGSALAQLNHFPTFAIILATAYEIRVSGGKRAINWVVVVGVGILFSFGVIYTSKEGMFTGPVTWLLTAMAYRFDFKAKYIIGGLLGSFFLIFYMVPYSQYVRIFRDKDGLRSNNQTIALEYIFKLNDVRQLYLAEEQNEEATEVPHFFNKPQGLLDRLVALPMDDALVDRTQEGYVFGLWPTYAGMLNTIPKLLWPNKPFVFPGNEYGREIGAIPADDFSTGISFSIGADMYHEAKWFGIFVVFPLVAFAYFLTNDTVAGNTRDSPWPLVAILLASHIGPEGSVDVLLLQVVEGSLGLFLMAGTIRYIFPMVVRVLTGGERTVVRKTFDFGPGRRPLNSLIPLIPLSPLGQSAVDAEREGTA